MPRVLQVWVLLSLRPVDKDALCSAACQTQPACDAAGNVATEDVVYLLDGLGVRHGVNLDKLLDASQYITSALGKSSQSRAGKAMLAKRFQKGV